ncbi:uncharacterized protein QC763_0107010 [Podospora pseudopauciseta]|uniref:Uncharacterized protein n=2 Tax=Podospora TaxID=5144 RepID=A0ABR0H1N9_9PEZI|nr:hypothetical protein QC763_0107010 [Podospora pseudopauciseta]KAK4668517.1 hypothetical protein QC764_0103000 [Podospora pseudoanserina]
MAETVLRKHRHSTKKRSPGHGMVLGPLGKDSALSSVVGGSGIQTFSFHLGTGASHKRKAHATV